MNIFISHNSFDKPKAIRIHNFFQNKGHQVFFDSFDLPYGESISKELDENLDKADVVVVLWSKHAAKSKGVKHEIDYSSRSQKKLLFCMLDNTPPPGGGKFGDLGINFTNFLTGKATLSVEISKLLPYEKVTSIDQNPSFKLAKLMEHFSRKDLKGKTSIEDRIPMMREVIKLGHEATAPHDSSANKGFKFINQLLDELAINILNSEALTSILEKANSSHYRNEIAITCLITPYINQRILELKGNRKISTKEAINSITNYISRSFIVNNEEITNLLSKTYPKVDIDTLADAVHKYIKTAPILLLKFEEYCQLEKHQYLSPINRTLKKYFIYNNNEILDDHNSPLGYLDDAYLIYNIIYLIGDDELYDYFNEFDLKTFYDLNKYIQPLFSARELSLLNDFILEQYESVRSVASINLSQAEQAEKNLQLYNKIVKNKKPIPTNQKSGMNSLLKIGLSLAIAYGSFEILKMMDSD